MTIQITFALVSAIAHGGLVLLVLLKKRKSQVLWAFLRLELALFVWNLGFYLSGISLGNSFWPRFMYFGVGTLAPSAILFAARLLQWRPLHRQIMGALSLICSALFIIWLGFTEWIAPSQGHPISNSQRDFLVIYTFPLLLYAVSWVAWKSFHTESRALRRHYNYIWMGSLAAVIAGLTDFMQGYGQPFTPLGNLVSAIYGGILYLAIARSRLLQLRLLFRRVILAAICLALAAAAYGLSSSHLGGDIWFPSILSAALIVLAVLSLIQEQSDLSQAIRRFLAGGPRLSEMIRGMDTSLTRAPDVEHLAEEALGLFNSFYPLKSAAVVRMVSTDIGHTLAASGEYAEKSIPVPPEIHPDIRPWGREELELAEDKAHSPESHAVLQWLTGLSADWCLPLGRPLRAFVLLRINDDAEIDNEEFATLALAFEERFLTLWEAIEIRAAAERAERLASLGKMAASVAHEIKNPLAAIQASAQYLESEIQNPNQRAYLIAIREETQRLSGVITNFLRYARPPELQVSSCHLANYLPRVVERLQPDPAMKNTVVDLAIPADLPPVLLDSAQFQQVLINLLLNAAPVARNVLIQCVYFENRVEIRIHDDGPGIPEEDQNRIFEPFFTTRPQGSGLGLAIVQGIVQAHGGSISLEAVDKGACFVIRLPVVDGGG